LPNEHQQARNHRYQPSGLCREASCVLIQPVATCRSHLPVDGGGVRA